jgi:hypothetical protein
LTVSGYFLKGGAMKADEYRRGYHDAMRKCVSMLHESAQQMNDDHARRVLNSAALDIGNYAAEVRRRHPVAEAQPVIGTDDEGSDK